MKSNEFEVICSTLDMFGGSDEYRGAVLVAALIRTFSKSISRVFSIGEKSFTIDIFTTEGAPPFECHCTFGNTYLYLFDEFF